MAIFLSMGNYDLIRKNESSQTMGPVDYLMVGFPGNKFTGKIMPELMDLEQRNIVRIIDLVFITKDSSGKVFVTEAKDLQGDAGKAFETLAKNTQEWFYEGDINSIAERLPNESSAALLLYENVWARKFKEDLLEADAEILDMGRIPQEAIDEDAKRLRAEAS
jgi:uncharacterized membrane protein